MNILDVQKPESTPNCLITGIFRDHQPLMEKYRLIEIGNGFHYPDKIPLDLHDRKDQHLLKDFKWRVVEELAEAQEAYYGEDQIHFSEELSDALHFLVELCILTGITPEYLVNYPLENHSKVMESQMSCMGVIDHINQTTLYLGLSANCLKNKPWKVHHMLTDVNKYRSLLAMAFSHLMCTFIELDLSDSQIYDLYFRKNKVNQFRIQSKY